MNITLNLTAPQAAALAALFNSSFLGGGLANVISANAAYAVVGGGVGNRASGIGSFIGGGGYDGVNSGANVASGAAATIGGGMGNYATDFYATVAGGIQNSAAGWAAVGGGLLNVASGIGSVVGGGGYDGFNVGPNLASGAASTVGGGWGNQATNYCATVAGGIQNSAAGWAAVGGGLANSASGIGSFVGGGGYDGVTIAGNAAGGAAAAVVGGWGNNAAGNYSFAAGHQAQALHDGCFVWSDALSAGIQSTAPNQFVIGASGGVQLVGNTGLNVNGAATFNGPIFLANAAAIHGSLAVYDGITVSGAITIYGTLEGADGYFQKVGIDKDLTVLGGATITGKTLAINEMDAVGGLFVRGALPNGWQLQLMNDSAGKPGGGSWGNTSDARIKKNIQPLTGALDKLTQLRGVTYEWINPQDHANQTNVQSGFIAQEVEQVFPDWISQVSPDEHDQALVPDGKVRTLSLPFGYDALVVEAIKEMRAEKDANIAELKSRNQELEQRVLKMETLIQKLTTAHKD